MTVKELLFETQSVVAVDLIKRVEEIVRIKCAEQRRLCADNAKIQKIIYRDGTVKAFIQEDWWYYPYGDGNQLIADKDSILNSPEPEL